MRKILSLLAATFVVSAAYSPSVIAKQPDPQARLARALEGRLAGEAVSCINLHDIRSTQVIDGTAILYEGRNGTIYLNRPDAGAESLDQWDVLVTKTSLPRLCDVDVVTLVDSGTQMQSGFVMLGKFVPYERVRKPD